MSTPNALPADFRKRVARSLRRASARSEQASFKVSREVGTWLADLRRVAQGDPQGALDMLFMLLEQLGRFATTVEDDQGLLARQMIAVLDQAERLADRELVRESARVDPLSLVASLFRLWLEDQEGIYPDIDGCMLSLSRHALVACELLAGLRQHIATLPLVFPAAPGCEGHLPGMIAVAERHRAERLLGEILARHDQHDYALIVARDHYRRSHDALDLVMFQKRAGHAQEAIKTARAALATPRAYHKKRLRELLDELLEETGETRDRRTRKTLENEFLANPCQKSFRALKKAVQQDVWPQVRKRVLGHLQKHQREPDVLFLLYVDEGELLEADGLVVTQTITADVLNKGADLVQLVKPDLAAGWLLCAAHRRTGQRKPSLYPQVARDLALVRKLAATCNQLEPFEEALKSFRTRYARRTRLMELLDEAGLV